MRLRLPTRPGRPSRPLLVVGGVLVLVLVVVAVVVVRQARERSPMQEALSMVPRSSERVTFTDWEAVRERVTRSPEPVRAGRVPALMDRAYTLDLSSASSIGEAAAPLAKTLGFSPGNARWEAFSQSPQGAVMVLRMADSVDLDDVASRLERAGYDEPDSDGGVWDGGPEVIGAIDSTLTPELQYVALDRDRHLVVSSDTSAYAASSLKAATGGSSLADTDAGERVQDLSGDTGELASAIVWPGDFACQDLAMSQAAPDDEAEADEQVSRLGGVDPVQGLVIGQRSDGAVRVALGFESGDQATNNLRPRAELVVGEDPSRPQPVSEAYRLTRSRTEGSAVLLDLRPRPDTGAALSSITAGPVLFATC